MQGLFDDMNYSNEFYELQKAIEDFIYGSATAEYLVDGYFTELEPMIFDMMDEIDDDTAEGLMNEVYDVQGVVMAALNGPTPPVDVIETDDGYVFDVDTETVTQLSQELADVVIYLRGMAEDT